MLSSFRLSLLGVLLCGALNAQPFADDLGIDSLVTPTNIQCVGSYPFTVCIKNHGTTTVTYCYVRYRVNGGSYVTTQFNGNLVPGDTMLYTVATIPMNNFGAYTVDILTSYVNTNPDPDHSNDTIHTSWNIINTVNVNAGPDVYFCPGDSATVSSNGPYTAYSWNSGNTTQSFVTGVEGLYIITATAANGCTDKDTMELIEMNATFHATEPYGYFGGGAESSTSFCDYNGDGYYDVLSTPQYLMLGDSTGNFTRIFPLPAGFPTNGTCNSWADMDNDGDEDVLISPNAGGARILENDSFSYVLLPGSIFNNQESSVQSWNVAWVDFNNDGFLDVIVGGQGNTRIKLFDGNSYPNDTIMNQSAYSLAITDMDNDGDQDFVVNYTSVFMTYINDGTGHFTTPTGNGLQYVSSNSAQSNSWGDFDNDGDMDLLSAQGANGTTRIFRNNMNGTFTALTNTGDLYTQNITQMSSCWSDYDGDGFLDVIVAVDQTTSTSPYFQVYHNNGDTTFTLMDNDTLGMNYTPQPVGSGRGVITSDFDNDGDLDIHIAAGTNLSGTTYRNDGNCNGWLNIRLEGTVSNRSAIGARIYAHCTIGGIPQILTREVQSITGNKSENDRRQHFGLGDATVVDSLVIHWPSGIVEVLYNVAPNQFMHIVEGIGPMGTDNIATTNSSCDVYPNPATDEINVVANCAEAGTRTIEVVSLNGQLVMEPAVTNCNTGKNLITLNVSSLEAGFYFIRISDGTSVQTMRFVIAE